MIAYWLKRLMWILGYRRVLWLPSEKGLSLADFWTWEYMPGTDKRDYTEHNYHRAEGERK